MAKNKKGGFFRVLKFIIFSAGAGIIQIVTFTLLNEVAGLSYWAAYLPSLVLSVLFNFTVNRKFTFKSANNVPLAMLLVAAYYAVFTPLSTLWGNALEKVGWNEYLILALTMATNLSTEFLYQRFVVYRKSVDTNADGQRASYSSVGDYNVGEDGYLTSWDTATVGYFVSELARKIEGNGTDNESLAENTIDVSTPETAETVTETPDKNKNRLAITYLGGGSYGKAYLVKTEDGAKVYKAVKFLSLAKEEYETLKLLREAAGNVIPEVYGFYEASEEVPIAVIVEEYIEGKSLVTPRLLLKSKKKRLALAEEVAGVISKIREKTADGFGKVCGEKYGSWTEYYRAFAEKVLADAGEAVACGLVKKEPVTLAEEAFERFDEIFASPIETPVLVHGDINIANIMVDPKTLKLKGIIDPYGSVFGDPDYELFQLQNMWGDRFFLYNTAKADLPPSETRDLKCAFYALLNEIHCAIRSQTSKGLFFDYMFSKQMKRLKSLL